MNETILEKIKKLQAMQQSAKDIGSDHEAASFAATVQALLFKHKIEMVELDNFSIMDDITIEEEVFHWQGASIGSTKKRSCWLTGLAYHVCNANGCQVLSIHGTNAVKIIGTADSIKITEYMLEVLARYGKNASDKAYKTLYAKAKKLNNIKSMKGYKRSFLKAFIDMIGIRLEESKNTAMAEVSERGLVVIDAEATELQKFIDNLNLKNSPAFAPPRNQMGYDDGKEAGNNVNLNYNAVGTEGSRVMNLS